jgi:hypothetical protein
LVFGLNSEGTCRGIEKVSHKQEAYFIHTGVGTSYGNFSIYEDLILLRRGV